MERGALLLALLVLTLPLAGCLGGSGGEAEGAAREAEPLVEGGTPAALEAAQAVADAPTWALGDAWTVAPQGGAGEESVLVVTAASADSYTLSTTSEGAAGYDALEDVSYLGRIRASDLAGSQQGQPVQFFSFPLTDGKSWQTTWDGRAVTLTATWVPAMPTSVGVHPGFTIEGKDEAGPYVKYDYVPMLKWWSHLSFASGYGFKVERVHANWTGTYLVAEAKTLLERGVTTPVASHAAETFTVDEGQLMVRLRLAGGAMAAARAFLLVTPEGDLYPAASPAGQIGGGNVDLEETLPPTPGEWRLLAPAAHSPDATYALLVQQVKVTPVAFP